MKLKDLWIVAPQSFVFIKNADGSVTEYTGGREMADRKVWTATATSYPMYKSVIEVKLVGDGWTA